MHGADGSTESAQPRRQGTKLYCERCYCEEMRRYTAVPSRGTNWKGRKTPPTPYRFGCLRTMLQLQWLDRKAQMQPSPRGSDPKSSAGSLLPGRVKALSGCGLSCGARESPWHYSREHLAAVIERSNVSSVPPSAFRDRIGLYLGNFDLKLATGKHRIIQKSLKAVSTPSAEVEEEGGANRRPRLC